MGNSKTAYKSIIHFVNRGSLCVKLLLLNLLFSALAAVFLARFMSLFLEVIFSHLFSELCRSIGLGSPAETPCSPGQSSNNAISFKGPRPLSHPHCLTDVPSDGLYLAKRWQKFKIPPFENLTRHLAPVR